ncbi:hypothetical protein [Streptomyces sp. NPDC029674]|uniref:hypothetical protein n=1 Tax=Streptomyces sp. NPDC029674 TaxID=3365297 RepID=UPI00384D2B92
MTSSRPPLTTLALTVTAASTGIVSQYQNRQPAPESSHLFRRSRRGWDVLPRHSAGRRGFLLAEAAAFLVLERLDHQPIRPIHGTSAGLMPEIGDAHGRPAVRRLRRDACLHPSSELAPGRTSRLELYTRFR